MTRPAGSFRSLLPFILGGVGVGLVLLGAFAVFKLLPASVPTAAAFDPLGEADDTAPPMVSIPAGTFVMGSDHGPVDERPTHAVTLRGFQIDVTEVTNAQFAAFVKATGYVTVAERQPDPKKYPTVPPGDLHPGSAVFVPVECDTDERTWGTPYPPWWQYVAGASWRRPLGPNDSLKGKMTHPVVHVAWEDAVAYATWAGKRLPTEAEWEYAARGGLVRQEYCWGSAKQGEAGKYFANTFQGTFPARNLTTDGHAGAAPVKSYPPNGYGLYDMSGNAWEWCSDWYDPGYYAKSPTENPPGPKAGVADAFGQPERVRRGGSFLCEDGYCRRYLPAARDKNPDDSAANHTGFRCVR